MYGLCVSMFVYFVHVLYCVVTEGVPAQTRRDPPIVSMLHYVAHRKLRLLTLLLLVFDSCRYAELIELFYLFVILYLVRPPGSVVTSLPSDKEVPGSVLSSAWDFYLTENHSTLFMD